MQIIVKGKQMEVTPRLRQHIERKVQRLARLVDEDTRVEVTVSEEKTRSSHDRFCVHFTLTTNPPVRSEVSGDTAQMALDLVLDKITAQLGRQKDRQTTKMRHRTPAVKVLSLSRAGMLSPLEVEAEETEEYEETSHQEQQSKRATPTISREQNAEIWSKVVEIRRVTSKPMDDQEVIAQMEASDLTFLPFFNEATNSVNVMYRLSKGGYGLLVPELD